LDEQYNKLLSEGKRLGVGQPSDSAGEEQLEPEGELMIMCDRCGYYCDAKLEECPTCSPPQQPSEGEIPKCPHENTFVCMRHCNTDSCGFHPNYQ